jgi:hypothetical protein
MNFFSKRVIVRSLAIVLVGALTAAGVKGQAPQPEKPLMADDVFKNIQVLHGLTVDQFMGTMGFIASALSMNCSECHDLTGASDFASDIIPRKQTARRMILMVDMFNKVNFAGKREVTCFSCHRGASRPKVTPSLAEQYMQVEDDDPNEVEPLETPVATAPKPEQILDKYIQAIGGAQRANAITSWTAKGTYSGFDTSDAKVPVDIYAKAPNQRTVLVHLPGAGDNARVCDGVNAWNTSNGTFMPIPVFPLSGGELQGAKLDAALSFPGQIKTLFKNWTANFPATAIDDAPVDVVQATQPDGTAVKFYFDKKTNLLLRQVRYTDTPIGLIPAQIDYSDYRPVAGVKLPFKMLVTWTDGRTNFELTEIRPNVPIDGSRFAKPVATGK